MKYPLKSPTRAVTPQNGELHERKSLNALNDDSGKIKRHNSGGTAVSLRGYRKERQKTDEKLARIFTRIIYQLKGRAHYAPCFSSFL